MDTVNQAPMPGSNPPAQETMPMSDNNQKVLRSFSTDENRSNSSGKSSRPLLIMALVVIFAGVATGWAIAKVENPSGSGTNSDKVSVNEGDLSSNEAGIGDESMFEEETPEGTLVEGGLEGEGTHHLDRGAGPTKMVYLTSSVINLDNFVGKKVRVWGNTMAAQKAPWLMDVGKIKVIE